MSNARFELFIVDPLNDFMDQPNAALPVPGGCQDMGNLSVLIDRTIYQWYDIHVSADCHPRLAVWHPIYWVDSAGNHPNPYTVITVEDVERGTWRTSVPVFQNRALDYVRKLRDNGRYDLTIWPYHCLKNTWGSCIYDPIRESLYRWEDATYGNIDIIPKGTNPHTEHYSSVQADVVDPNDDTTMLNDAIIKALSDPKVEKIVFAGEALNFCVANTVWDISNNFGEENVKKIVLLTDACSSILLTPEHQNMHDKFLKEMTARGMKLSTTVDFLAAA